MRIQIVDRESLERFARDWTWHHPLTPEQFACAGRRSIVQKVGFYHGGDALYELEGIAGTWHEACLKAVE